MWMLSLQVSRSVCVMTTQLIFKLLRSKEASAAVDVRSWPPVLDTGTHTHTHTCVWQTLRKHQAEEHLFTRTVITNNVNVYKLYIK